MELGVVNRKIADRFLTLYRSGARRIALKGGRRTGKTCYVADRELTRCATKGAVVNVATMTQEQGRLGVYADACNIISGTDRLSEWLIIKQSPREITCPNGGRLFFNSYQNAETAKGIACDDAFINEANNFTLKQVQDIIASVRDCAIFDYNQSPEWRAKIIPDDCVVMTWWWENPYLTPSQKQYFDDLKKNAESPDATAMDVWLYRVYYLGEDAEVGGEIFSPANIKKIAKVPDNVGRIIAFADPSAMRGADFFAMVIGATDGDKVYILDSFSENIGRPEITAYNKLVEWHEKYNCNQMYIESNGAGLSFYEFCYNSGLPVQTWASRANKFQRIADNYQALTERVVWLDTDANNEYLQQVYDFGERCLHDDNIDAVNSLWLAYRYNSYVS